VFDLHLQACNGVRLTVDDKPYPCPIPMGLQIIYAKHSFKIPMGMIWPNWVVDRPAGGVFIGKGQPVCSIIAQGNNTDKVQNRLQRWQKIIENLLQTGLYHHAISD
jgi:methenyltetrahydromethanopterin cyclohydrolase